MSERPSVSRLDPAIATAIFDPTQQEIIAGIPAVTVVGLDDPLTRPESAGFPEVGYHAYRSQDGKEFQMDVYYGGGVFGVGNNFFGDGLYVGKRDLAGLYAEKLQNEKVARILPYRARLIDTSLPAYKEPLSERFGKSFHAYVQADVNRYQVVPQHDPTRTRAKDYLKTHTGRYLSTDDEQRIAQGGDASKANWLTRRYNTGQLAAAIEAMGERAKTTLPLLLFTEEMVGADGKHYPLDKKVVYDFLMSRGVDGIKSTFQPSVGGEHEAVAYWRNDRIGDQRVWESRARQYERARDIGGKLLRGGIPQKETGKLFISYGPLIGAPKLDIPVASQLIEKLNRSEPLIAEDEVALLWSKLHSPTLQPKHAVGLMAQLSPDLAKLMNSPVGVWEGYKLQEHTQAVLGQFETNFAPAFVREHSGDNARWLAIMRTTLLLQDIGKPVYALNGNTEQSVYNQAFAKNILTQLPEATATKQLILDLLSHDYIGSAMKDGSEAAMQRSVAGARKVLDRHESLVGRSDLFQMMSIIYMSDASAYTTHASYYDFVHDKQVRCKLSSLENVFEKAPRANRIRLTPTYRARMDQLAHAILNK